MLTERRMDGQARVALMQSCSQQFIIQGFDSYQPYFKNTY